MSDIYKKTIIPFLQDWAKKYSPSSYKEYKMNNPDAPIFTDPNVRNTVGALSEEKYWRAKMEDKTKNATKYTQEESSEIENRFWKSWEKVHELAPKKHTEKEVDVFRGRKMSEFKKHHPVLGAVGEAVSSVANMGGDVEKDIDLGVENVLDVAGEAGKKVYTEGQKLAFNIFMKNPAMFTAKAFGLDPIKTEDIMKSIEKQGENVKEVIKGGGIFTYDIAKASLSGDYDKLGDLSIETVKYAADLGRDMFFRRTSGGKWLFKTIPEILETAMVDRYAEVIMGAYGVSHIVSPKVKSTLSANKSRGAKVFSDSIKFKDPISAGEYFRRTTDKKLSHIKEFAEGVKGMSPLEALETQGKLISESLSRLGGEVNTIDLVKNRDIRESLNAKKNKLGDLRRDYSKAVKEGRLEDANSILADHNSLQVEITKNIYDSTSPKEFLTDYLIDEYNKISEAKSLLETPMKVAENIIKNEKRSYNVDGGKVKNANNFVLWDKDSLITASSDAVLGVDAVKRGVDLTSKGAGKNSTYNIFHVVRDAFNKESSAIGLKDYLGSDHITVKLYDEMINLVESGEVVLELINDQKAKEIGMESAGEYLPSQESPTGKPTIHIRDNVSPSLMAHIFTHESIHHVSPIHYQWMAEALSEGMKAASGVTPDMMVKSGMMERFPRGDYVDIMNQKFMSLRHKYFNDKNFQSEVAKKQKEQGVGRAEAIEMVYEDKGCGVRQRQIFIEHGINAEMYTEGVARTITNIWTDPQKFVETSNKVVLKTGDLGIKIADAVDKYHRDYGEYVKNNESGIGAYATELPKVNEIQLRSNLSIDGHTGMLKSEIPDGQSGLSITHNDVNLNKHIFSYKEGKVVHPVGSAIQDLVSQGVPPRRAREIIKSVVVDPAYREMGYESMRDVKFSEYNQFNTNMLKNLLKRVPEMERDAFISSNRLKIKKDDMKDIKKGILTSEAKRRADSYASYLDGIYDISTRGEYRNYLYENFGVRSFSDLLTENASSIAHKLESVKSDLSIFFKKLADSGEKIPPGVSLNIVDNAMRKMTGVKYPETMAAIEGVDLAYFMSKVKAAGIRYKSGKNKGLIKDPLDISPAEAMKVKNLFDVEYTFGASIRSTLNRAGQAVNLVDIKNFGGAVRHGLLNVEFGHLQPIIHDKVIVPSKPFKPILGTKRNAKSVGEYVALKKKRANLEALGEDAPIKFTEGEQVILDNLINDLAGESVTISGVKMSALNAADKFIKDVIDPFYAYMADLDMPNGKRFIENPQPDYYPVQIDYSKAVGEKGAPRGMTMVAHQKKKRAYLVESSILETDPITIMHRYARTAVHDIYTKNIKAVIDRLGSLKEVVPAEGSKAMIEHRTKKGLIPEGVTRVMLDDLSSLRGDLMAGDYIAFAKEGVAHKIKEIFKDLEKNKVLDTLVDEQLKLIADPSKKLSALEYYEAINNLKSFISTNLLMMRYSTVTQQFFQPLDTAVLLGGSSYTKGLVKYHINKGLNAGHRFARAILHSRSDKVGKVLSFMDDQKHRNKKFYDNVVRQHFGDHTVMADLVASKHKSKAGKRLQKYGFMPFEFADMKARMASMIIGDEIFNNGYFGNNGKKYKDFKKGKISASEFGAYLGSDKLFAFNEFDVGNALKKYETLRGKIEHANKTGMQTVMHDGFALEIPKAKEVLSTLMEDANIRYMGGVSAWVNFYYDPLGGMRWTGTVGKGAAHMTTFKTGKATQFKRLITNTFSSVHRKGLRDPKLLAQYTERMTKLLEAENFVRQKKIRNGAALARFLGKEFITGIPLKVLGGKVAIDALYGLMVSEFSGLMLDEKIEPSDVKVELGGFMGSMLEFTNFLSWDSSPNAVASFIAGNTGPALNASINFFTWSGSLGIGLAAEVLGDKATADACYKNAREAFRKIKSVTSPAVYSKTVMGVVEALYQARMVNKNPIDLIGTITGLDGVKIGDYTIGERTGLSRTYKGPDDKLAIDFLWRLFSVYRYDTPEGRSARKAVSDKYKKAVKNYEEMLNKYGDGKIRGRKSRRRSDNYEYLRKYMEE